MSDVKIVLPLLLIHTLNDIFRISKTIAETLPWSVKVRTALKNVFHLNEFRSQQLQAINSVMARNDTLLIVPTGGGKSLCYQLPAVLASNALTVVISPLISLMEDQVWSLQKLNIEAELLSATIDKSKNNTIIKQIAEADGPCEC